MSCAGPCLHQRLAVYVWVSQVIWRESIDSVDYIAKISQSLVIRMHTPSNGILQTPSLCCKYEAGSGGRAQGLKEDKRGDDRVEEFYKFFNLANPLAKTQKFLHEVQIHKLSHF